MQIFNMTMHTQTKSMELSCYVAFVSDVANLFAQDFSFCCIPASTRAVFDTNIRHAKARSITEKMPELTHTFT